MIADAAIPLFAIYFMVSGGHPSILVGYTLAVSARNMLHCALSVAATALSGVDSDSLNYFLRMRSSFLNKRFPRIDCNRNRTISGTHALVGCVVLILQP